MEKHEIHIAILDDDITLGKALKAVIEAEGFKALVYDHPDKLLKELNMRPIHLFIVDCMLPKISGLEVCEQIQLAQKQQAKILLISGIYQDKVFIRSALTKTKALGFLEKPFELDDIKAQLNEILEGLYEAPLNPLIELHFNPAASVGEKLKAIKQAGSIHGLRVPRILALLMTAKANGCLTLETKNEVSKVFFSDGNIVRVNNPDPKSFFGALLVDKNYLSTEELEMILHQDNEKKLGERLVESNLLSPHIIEIINNEQLGLRLSQIIKNESYKINFTQDTTKELNAELDFTNFMRFTSDWLNSKFTYKWLKNNYLPFMDKKMIKSSNYAEISPILNFYPIPMMPNFLNTVLETNSLEDLVNELSFGEEQILKAIHLLVIGEFIAFGKEDQVVDGQAHYNRLARIKRDMAKQNHFEILGLNEHALSRDIKKAFINFSKIFHPDKVPNDAPKGSKEITEFIFNKISIAYKTLSNDESKDIYVKELELGQAEAVMESEVLIDEGRSFMKSNQAAKALDRFMKALELRPPSTELMLNYLWARLRTVPKVGVEDYLNSIEKDLNKVPPEERHNSMYYFVKGLFRMELGDLDQAIKNFKHALSMDGNQQEIKRALNIALLKKQEDKPLNFWKADLKDVVGMVFKKKKK